MKHRQKKPPSTLKSGLSTKSGVVQKRQSRARVEEEDTSLKISTERFSPPPPPPPHTLKTRRHRSKAAEGAGFDGATIISAAQVRPYYSPQRMRFDNTLAMPSQGGRVQPLRSTAGSARSVTPARLTPALELPPRPPVSADSDDGLFETGGNGMIMAIKLRSSSPSQMRNMTFEEAVPRANQQILPPDISYSLFRRRWLRRAREGQGQRPPRLSSPHRRRKHATSNVILARHDPGGATSPA